MQIRSQSLKHQYVFVSEEEDIWIQIKSTNETKKDTFFLNKSSPLSI